MSNKSNHHLQIFSDIHSYANYSQMSKNLNKIYKNKCFDSFYENLKRPKAISLSNDFYSCMMLQPYSSTNTKRKNEIAFSSELVEEILQSEGKSMERKHSLSRNQKNLEKEKKYHHHNVSLIKNKIVANSKSKQSVNTNYSGKYNPNYAAIYPNKPTVNFAKNTGRKVLKKTYGVLSFPKLEEEKNKDIIIEEKPMTETKTKTEIKTGNETESTITNKNNYHHDRNNHSLRFSKYSWRKDQRKSINSSDQRNDSFQHYVTESSNSNGMKSVKGIDYSKMKCINHDLFIPNKQNDNIPTIGMYNPQYKCISKNLPNVVFKVEREKLHNKKYHLRKLWYNYDVSSNYQLVKLGKINSINLLI